MILLFPEMRVTQKIFTRAATKNSFVSIKLTFLNNLYTEKTTLTALFFVEKQRTLLLLFKGEKT